VIVCRSRAWTATNADTCVEVARRHTDDHLALLSRADRQRRRAEPAEPGWSGTRWPMVDEARHTGLPLDQTRYRTPIAPSSGPGLRLTQVVT
jgi:hypothetical protein